MKNKKANSSQLIDFDPFELPEEEQKAFFHEVWQGVFRREKELLDKFNKKIAEKPELKTYYEARLKEIKAD